MQEEDEEEEEGRRQDGTSARKLVATTICGLFLFSFRFIYFFICLNFSYWPTFIFRPKSGIQPGTTETSPI